MDEREHLIQSIMDAPDDDAPRLAYADHQEAHGDPAHAELIRVQCELARLPAKGRKRKPLAAREAELLQRPENAALTQYENEFERGMVHLARWYGGNDSFDYDATPLERVLFLDACDFGDSNWPDEAAAARIAAAPWARRIRRIAFHEFAVEPAVVRALAGSPNLINLREVIFSDTTTDPAAVADLVLAPSVCGIETLMLQGDSGGWEGLGGPLGRILSDPRSARLRRLYLLALGLTDEIVEVLVRSERLEGAQVWICERLPWLTPDRLAALQVRFGESLVLEWQKFIDPYFF